jgi:cytochrome oxidase assembly protein ShyY1
VRRTTVALILSAALIAAAVAVGAWELRRLDHDVKALEAEVEDRAESEPHLESTLKSLTAPGGEAEGGGS